MCRLLHIRGGVSAADITALTQVVSSPRTWRCFLSIWTSLFIQTVFSTYVEVFPFFYRYRWNGKGLLHVRGGVSICDEYVVRADGSSPRTWRCFSAFFPAWRAIAVFSTYVEVFLICGVRVWSWASLLHVRGGVSACAASGLSPPSSSPRTWRCFLTGETS